MALDPATIIQIVTTVASVAGAASSRSKGLAAKEKAIQSSALQEKFAAQERTQSRTEQLDAVLGSQVASAAARGINLASPSFQAIQKSSLNAFAQDQFADNFNLTQREQLFESQKQDLIQRNQARLFTDIFGAAATSFGLDTPSAGGSAKTKTSTLGTSFSFNTLFKDSGAL